MKTLERIRNFFKLFSLKRDEVIYTCIQNNIPLTDENIKDVLEIFKQKEHQQILENYKLNKKK